jgi:hypothetical protein
MSTQYFGSWPVKHLSLKDLTLKLCMLIALTNAARIQSLHLLSVNSVQKFSSEFVFHFEGLLKQCRPGYKSPVLSVKSYERAPLAVFNEL